MVETIRNSTLVVGTDSTIASEELFGDTQRKVLVITNTSTAGQVVTLSFGADAVAGSGIVLYPTGTWSESIDSKFIPANARVFAIASAAAGAIAIHERVVQGERLFARG